jgi:hypothetical protein
MAENPFEMHYKPGEELVLKFKSVAVEELVPKELRSHLLAARKETLLAIRTIIDKAIEHTEAKATSPKAKKKSKVEVE